MPDVALVTNKQFSVLKNNGSGVLSLANTYTIQQPGYAIVTADLNGDGDLDLVVFGTDSRMPCGRQTTFSYALKIVAERRQSDR